MDLNALAGAYPLACLPLVFVYPAANRVWGDDPRRVIGKTLWSGRRIFIALMLLIGVPLGYLSAGIGGAAMPFLFGLWRAIVIGKDWATPDTTKEVIVAFVRDMIPAAIVALTLFVCQQNRYSSPFEWLLVLTLAAHASLAVALAVRFAHTEKALAAQLASGAITQTACDDQIDEANAKVELLQGLTFVVAVVVWTLLR